MATGVSTTLVDEEEGHLLIRLLDLPGVREIEALLARAVAARGKNWQWCDEYDEAKALAERVSRQAFGIAEADTRHVDDPKRSREDNDNEGGWWESHFRGSVENNQPDPGADWAALDWDVSDEAGRPLRALGFFHRQIVAVEYGLCGHLPGEVVDLSPAEAKAIEARLQADFQLFKAK